MKKPTEEFNSLFIQSFKPEDFLSLSIKEGIKHHYTSPEAFLSIIQEKKIRFTDYRYMNDKSENVYVVKVLLDFLEKNKGKYPNAEEVVYEMLKENDLKSIQNLDICSIKYTQIPRFTYKPARKCVFCMCDEQDSLHMWNYYVNNNSYRGMNIGIKVINFLNIFDSAETKLLDPIQIFYGSVLYNQNKQFKEIETLMKNTEKCIKSIHSNNNNNNQKYAILRLREYIDTKGLFYKSVKFKDEKEYRIVIEIDEKILDANKIDGIEECYCVKNGIISPYLNVQLPNDAISSVCLSPMTEFQISHDSIKRLLEHNEFINFSICKSKIPIRY